LQFAATEGEDEAEETLPLPNPDSLAEVTSDFLFGFREQLKLIPVPSWDRPSEYVMDLVKDMAVDATMGAVSIAVHNQVKKIEPTAHANSAFYLSWLGNTQVPGMLLGNHLKPTKEVLSEGQKILRNEANSLNFGHANFGVVATSILDDVATEAILFFPTLGLSTSFRGATAARNVGEESIELLAKTIQKLDDEAIEAASKARQLLDNADGVPLEKVADDAPPTELDHLRLGREFESKELARNGLDKETYTRRPTEEQIQSTAFKIIVGEPKYTNGGKLTGTIFDSTGNLLTEIIFGRSTLSSSYQLRLQTYFFLIDNAELASKNLPGVVFKLRTTRPINQTFRDWLQRWGVVIEDIK
jgi:hypothetical protein